MFASYCRTCARSSLRCSKPFIIIQAFIIIIFFIIIIIIIFLLLFIIIQALYYYHFHYHYCNLSEAKKFFAHHGLELAGAEFPIVIQQLAAQRNLSKIIFNQVDGAHGWQILKKIKKIT
jgi:hypothetical protein